MAREIAWRVIFETDRERGKFPVTVSEHKISDKLIKQYLKDCVEAFEIPYNADVIYNLSFIAAFVDDVDNDNIKLYIEPLSPFDFWPRLPKKVNPKNKSLFRE